MYAWLEHNTTSYKASVLLVPVCKLIKLLPYTESPKAHSVPMNNWDEEKFQSTIPFPPMQY